MTALRNIYRDWLTAPYKFVIIRTETERKGGETDALLRTGDNTMKRIIVIGCPGAGKTTFAEGLHKKTGLPLFYLDAI